MAARKTAALAGPTCPDCRALAADLARLQRQQRKQTAELRQLVILLQQQRAELAEERERSGRLNEALSYHRFVQPYLLHQFGQHLPEKNALAAGLAHLN